MIGRLVEDGETGTPPCTATLTSGGFFISAGHCEAIGYDVVEFNVPASTSGGVIQFSEPEDQYPINFTTDLSENVKPYTPFPDYDLIPSKLGQDWWLFDVGVNGDGELPFDNQQSYLRLSGDYSSPTGLTGTIEGYGSDTGVDNNTLQKDSEDILDLEYNGGNTYWEYETDTAAGDSGALLTTSGIG